MNAEKTVVDHLVATQLIDLHSTDAQMGEITVSERVPRLMSPIRMLRLSQVREITGLGKTKIYELQSQGDFPLRVQMTAHSVAWIEEEVRAWLMKRIENRTTPRPAS